MHGPLNVKFKKNVTFVDFSPTAVNICSTEGRHNYSVGFTLHILNSGWENISFIVSGMQSDQHGGARVHWRRVLCEEFIRKKKTFSEIKVYFYFKNSKWSSTNLKLSSHFWTFLNAAYSVIRTFCTFSCVIPQWLVRYFTSLFLLKHPVKHNSLYTYAAVRPKFLQLSFVFWRLHVTS